MGTPQKTRSKNRRDRNRKKGICLDCPNKSYGHSRCKACRELRAEAKRNRERERGIRERKRKSAFNEFTINPKRMIPQKEPATKSWWMDKDSPEYQARFGTR